MSTKIIDAIVSMQDASYEMQRLQKARTGLIMGSPFFGTLALQLTMKLDPKSETAFWIDGTTVAVHPDIAREMPMGELEGLLARATLNAALGHPLRREGREAKRWNEACAHVAGLEVTLAGMLLPEGSPADPAYRGMSAPQVYGLLAPPPGDDDGQGGAQGGAGDQGRGKPQPQGEQPPSEPPSGSPDDSQGQGEGAPEGSPSPGSGEVRDAEGDEAAIEEQAAKWQEAVAQAAQVARAQGKLPGDLERAALAVVNPRVGWREALARFFKARARDDSSWMRPNRRFLTSGFYLPSLDSQRMGPIAIAIDLSGSISQHEIDQFLAEMHAIRGECNPESFVLLPFDTGVRSVSIITEGEELEFKAKAGGGTDFEPIPRALAELAIVPEVLVYLTDLDCSSFPEEPEYPVLWVTTNRDHAPFGEVIRME